MTRLAKAMDLIHVALDEIQAGLPKDTEARRLYRRMETRTLAAQRKLRLYLRVPYVGEKLALPAALQPPASHNPVTGTGISQFNTANEG